ncbi:hypothetical protein J2Z83_000516 [Virgibacillus natechei]|uniref:Uncharacterized protein n=1 Tax=Virgibacillus natechei TaxID=1216297 RepID=A0ABS4IEG3_9BACI|nr:hypothetical protein [Virgibacillus natechei]MBP1968424.1 hypothetical protein [Virgibacillus natechei]UZD13547.1 hypothetical protein OLD84_03030 [Virgibacillus natechei]
MEEKLNTILEHLEILQQGQVRFEERQDRFEASLNIFGERLGQVERSQEKLVSSQELLAINQASMEERQIRLEENQTNMEKNQELFALSQVRLETKLDNFMVETRGNFKHVQSQLDRHTNLFKKVQLKH